MAGKSVTETYPVEQHSVNEANSEVVSASTPQSTAKREPMSEEMTSIIEYDAPIADAEPPVPLPKGEYPATVTGAEIKTSAKGNKYVNVTFRVPADAYPPDYTEGNEDGTVLSYGRLSPDNTQRARYGMRKFCESIGAELGNRLDLNDWLGKTAIVTVVNERYEGVEQAKITKVGAAD